MESNNYQRMKRIHNHLQYNVQALCYLGVGYYLGRKYQQITPFILAGGVTAATIYQKRKSKSALVVWEKMIAIGVKCIPAAAGLYLFRTKLQGNYAYKVLSQGLYEFGIAVGFSMIDLIFFVVFYAPHLEKNPDMYADLPGYRKFQLGYYYQKRNECWSHDVKDLVKSVKLYSEIDVSKLDRSKYGKYGAHRILTLQFKKFFGGAVDGREIIVGEIKRAFRSLVPYAVMGETDAEYYVGNVYYRGLISMVKEKDPSLAFSYFKKAADKGKVEAQFMVGLCYYSGIGVKEDNKLAFQYFKKAADCGHIEAQHFVGLCYFRGEGVPQSNQLGFEYTSKAADKGDITSLYNLGQVYLGGKYGIKEDTVKAFGYFKRAADKGLADALYMVGTMYEKGKGVDKNSELASQSLVNDADKGSANASIMFGTAHEEEKEVDENSKLAFQSFVKAADQGFDKALKKVVLYYSEGKGVERDVVKAFEYFKKAADKRATDIGGSVTLDGIVPDYFSNFESAFNFFKEVLNKGSVDALYYLGLCNLYGKGTQQNSEEAYKCFEGAAAVGSADAQYYAGLCNLNGNGTQQNFEEAFKFFEKAANQGHSDALNELGLCYLEGKGVEQNSEEAFKYLKEATDKGVGGDLIQIGERYLKGNGVEKSYEFAFKYFKEVADKGCGANLYRIVENCFRTMNMNNSTVSIDASTNNNDPLDMNNNNNNNHEDMFSVASPFQSTLNTNNNNNNNQENIFSDDSNSQPNKTSEEIAAESAFQFFNEVAEKQYADAQYQLGVCYLEGKGVEKNLGLAEKYLNDAENNGFKNALYILKSATPEE